MKLLCKLGFHKIDKSYYTEIIAHRYAWFALNKEFPIQTLSLTKYSCLGCEKMIMQGEWVENSTGKINETLPEKEIISLKAIKESYEI
jgi:hypothetical protein